MKQHKSITFVLILKEINAFWLLLKGTVKLKDFFVLFFFWLEVVLNASFKRPL